MVSIVSRLPGSPFRKMMVAGSFGFPSYVTVTGWPGSTSVGTDVNWTLP